MIWGLLQTSLRLSWSPLGVPETSRASKSDAQSSCGQIYLWFWAVYDSFGALNMTFEQLWEHLTHLIIKHHKQSIYQVYSTSKQLSILNNLVTKQLSNLCNSPTKLKTPLILPLIGYWWCDCVALGLSSPRSSRNFQIGDTLTGSPVRVSRLFQARP